MDTETIKEVIEAVKEITHEMPTEDILRSMAGHTVHKNVCELNETMATKYYALKQEYVKLEREHYKYKADAENRRQFDIGRIQRLSDRLEEKDNQIAEYRKREEVASVKKVAATKKQRRKRK